MTATNGRPVRAVWYVDVKPGRMAEMMRKFEEVMPLAERVWGRRGRVLRSTVAGAASGRLLVYTDFDSAHDLGERIDRAQSDEEWQGFLAWINGADSPGTLSSVSMMTDVTPGT